MTEAADKIERLQAEIERLDELLWQEAGNRVELEAKLKEMTTRFEYSEQVILSMKRRGYS